MAKTNTTKITMSGFRKGTNGSVWANIPASVMKQAKIRNGFVARKTGKRTFEISRARKSDASYFLHSDGRGKIPVSEFIGDLGEGGNSYRVTKREDGSVRLTVI